MATVVEVKKRQDTIVALTNEFGRCSVAEIAERFEVTPETIRRDLKILESRNLLRRVHGGAVSGSPHSHVELLAVDESDELPIHQSQRRKQSIALAALGMIPHPNASMFIDAGSTTEAFANVLASNYLGQNWSVVTNSPNIARSLAVAGVPRVAIVGGFVKARTQAIVGPKALDEMQVLRADIAFLGTSGLSFNKGLTTSDPREAQVKNMMLLRSERSVVLVDSTKIDHDSEVRFADISDIHTVITDRNAPEGFARRFKSISTQLLIP